MRGRGGRAADRRTGEGPDDDGLRKRHGRHYTPPRLAEFLAERTIARLQLGAEVSVLDPACGDGELLLAVARLAARRFPEVSWRLVGRDSDADAVRVSRARSAGFAARSEHRDAPGDGGLDGAVSPPARATSAVSIRFEWSVADFLGAAPDEAAGPGDARFDAVITNPPYVRTQQLGGATAQLLSRQFGLSGRIDLTHPFVASVPLLLRPDGVLGLLCANRFLTTKAGANLRTVLSQELTPVELYDLGDTRLFDAAVLPAVTIAVRGPVAQPCRFAAAYETDRGSTSTAGLFESLTAARDCVIEHGERRIAIESGILCTGAGRWSRTAAQDTVTAEPGPPAAKKRGAPLAPPPAFDASIPWRMSRPGTDEWLRRIGERTWRTFGEVARIRVGIKTTADRVFISDRWDEQPLRPEAELLRTLLTHHDVAPWRIERAHDTKVLYPYDVSQSRRTPVQLGEYPAARAYLAQHREVLSARDYLVGSGREWFEIWVPQRPDLWGHPKVVFPDISVAPRFALDRSGAVVNGDCYWMSLHDIGDERIAYLLMGVANSTLGLRFYDAVCGNRLYAGRRRWITQYVTRLPLPDPATGPARSLIALAAEFAGGGAEPDIALLDDHVAQVFGVHPGGLRPDENPAREPGGRDREA